MSKPYKVNGIGRNRSSRSVTIPDALCRLAKDLQVDDQIEIYVNSRKEIVIRKITQEGKDE